MRAYTAIILFVLSGCSTYADECFLPVTWSPAVEEQDDSGVWWPEEPQRIQTGRPMNITIANDYTALIAKLNKERDEAETQEAKRALSIAITKLEEAQMWTGKAFAAEMVNDSQVDTNY